MTVPNRFLIRKLFWREWFEGVVAAVLVAGTLRLFIIEPYRIPSVSMEPTLLPGDFVLVSKTSFGLHVPMAEEPIAHRLPQRGNVIVFRNPRDEGMQLIKRVVALPGDRVAIRDGSLFVNDREVTGASDDRGYAEEINDRTTHRVKRQSGRDEADFFGPVVVPPDHVFVLGDNRGESEDSRVLGAVPTRQITGRAVLIWFSVEPSDPNSHAIRWDRILTSIP